MKVASELLKGALLVTSGVFAFSGNYDVATFIMSLLVLYHVREIKE